MAGERRAGGRPRRPRRRVVGDGARHRAAARRCAWLAGPTPWPGSADLGFGSMPPLRVRLSSGCSPRQRSAWHSSAPGSCGRPSSRRSSTSGILESSGKLSTRRDATIALPMSDGRILVGGYGADDGAWRDPGPGHGSSDSIWLAETNVGLIGASTLPDGRVLLSPGSTENRRRWAARRACSSTRRPAPCGRPARWRQSVRVGDGDDGGWARAHCRRPLEPGDRRGPRHRRDLRSRHQCLRLRGRCVGHGSSMH